MKLAGISIVSFVALAGCPKGSSAPKADLHTCADVEAHAAKLYSYAAPPRRDAAVGRDLFAQAAPAEDREPTAAELARLEGEAWGLDCSGHGWTQAQIDCYVGAPTVDDGKACVDAGVDPVAVDEPDDDPACVAAADHGAVIVAKVNDASGDAEVIARAREAILQPCLASRYPDGMLDCLSDPEQTTLLICEASYSSEPEWQAFAASLDAAGLRIKPTDSGTGWY